MADRIRAQLHWAVPALVLGIAALLRMWALGRPDQLVFDELYYVRDAVSQLAHGFPTTWPDDDPAFDAARAAAFGSTASSISHPPLGKWLIGLGVLVFGPGTGWGWRIAAAVAGVATVAVTMRLARLMSGSRTVAAIAGLLLALDGVHVVLSRVGLLDGFLTLGIALGALFVWHDQASGRRGWFRPWLVAAGLAFGAAAAVKWSGLYPLAAFLALIVIRDLVLRLRTASATPQAGRSAARWRAGLDAARGAVRVAAVVLPTALLAYVASWTGWILHPDAQDRLPGVPWWRSLIEWHSRMLAWHASLTAEHPYQSSPWEWPLAMRPTAMYRVTQDQGPGCPWAGGCVSTISPLPNPIVTWGGVLALLLLAAVAIRLVVRAIRLRSWAPLGAPALWSALFVLTGYLSGWLPWLLVSGRSAVFQFYTVVLTPFAALALALVLGALVTPDGGPLARAAGVRLDAAPGAVLGRRISVAVLLAFAAAMAVLFFPLWSGMPVAEWFTRAHLWLPGWR